MDTHCHLNFDSFDADRAAVIERARANGVVRIIVPAVDLQTSREALELAAAHRGVIFAAAGVHPNSAAVPDTVIDAVRAFVYQAAEEQHIVAIGEIGLDYYRDRTPRDRQWRVFEQQLGWAAQLRLPVIIHNRDAHDDVITLLEQWAADLPADLRDRAGVLHSFSAPLEIAERAVAAGFYLGFTGPLTYKNADGLRHIAARVPLERLLVETDAPFLAPVPHRGQRNEPAYARLVAERLAGLRLMPYPDLARITTHNVERLFQLSHYT